jgi:hypothetical protein
MTRVGELPQFVRDLLASPPKAGEGVNLWLFRVARVLHACRTETEILDTLRAVTVGCGRVVTEKEIRRAMENSRTGAGTAAPVRLTPPWPMLNREQREAIINEGGRLVDLWEVSPLRLEDNDSHTEQIVDVLFPGNPLLFVGATNAVFATQSREEWRGKLTAMQFIVPSPMIARTGRTQDGRQSAHSLENTGPRRFLVIEQDQGTIDEQAAILLHLAKLRPMALAAHSGSKSLHGWFYCAGQSEERAQAFMRYGATLGADPATWTRSQFVRMPDGTRDNGNRQTVYFLNPRVVR